MSPRRNVSDYPTLTTGERALLWAVAFFATAGTALFAGTMPAPATFLLGMGWMLVLLRVDEWARA